MNKLIPAACMALLLVGCARAGAPAPSASDVTAETVENALSASGMKINGKLDAPDGYQGFVGQYRGRKLPVYVMPDGKHLIIGTMYDLSGHDLTTPAMRQVSAFTEAQWKTLEKSTWVAEGDADAKRVVYVFTDTECPYCHKFWKASQPWVNGGDVQVRNILVAVISPKSLPRAAGILTAADPAMAWTSNEANFGNKDAPVNADVSAAAERKIKANNDLMVRLGFYGTPGVVYKDADGTIHTVHGLPPDPERLKAIFEG
ncbi:MAG TPA: thiol:disulfide interchange protein DsbG [Oleiagrimonas sp.]|nr:thiol:disulfide interchange protein DsbG [Oleiagrimonas sp.]